MSRTVDTRTVEMRFDNKNFESNVKQSMSTLDKLKEKLKLDGASKGLKEVEKSSKKLEFKDLTKSIDDVGKKFSALETIATGVFLRIGMNAADAGAKILKSFTIDQVSAGWNKYADKTSAVQMIMANLRDDTGKWVDEASKMEYVNEQLEKLLLYSDETSYRFSDMIENSAKFIAQGFDMERTVTAMEGIAGMSAAAGIVPQEAGSIFEAFSRVMQQGYVSARQYYMLQKVFTSEAKEQAIAIGESLGLIKKGTVTVENFRDSFVGKGENSWFNKEVIDALLSLYGKGADKVITRMQEAEKLGKSISAIDALKELEAEDDQFSKTIGHKAFLLAEEAKTFREAMDSAADAVSTKWSSIFELIFGDYLEAKELWTNFANDLWTMFAAPLDDLKEIVSIWKTGFGQGPKSALDLAYENGVLDNLSSSYDHVSRAAAEAAVASSKAGDDVYYEIEKLEDGSERFVKYVKEASGAYHRYWKYIYNTDKGYISGRTLLFDGLRNVMEAFFLGWEEEVDGVVTKHLSVFGAIKQAFMEVFFPDLAAAEDGGKKSIAEWLYDLTKKFKEFTEKLKPLGDKLKNIFKGFFTVINIIRKFIMAIIKPFKDLFSNLFEGAPEGVLGFADSISTWVQEFDKFLEENKVFEKVSNGIKEGLNKISEGLDWLSRTLTGLSLKELTTTVKNKILEFFQNYDFKGHFEKIGGFFSNIINQIKEVETEDLPDKLTPLQNFWIGFKKIWEGIKKFFSLMSVPFKKIGEFIASFFTGLTEAAAGKETDKKVSKLKPILDGIKKVFQGIVDFFEKIGPALEKIGSWLGEKISGIGDAIGEFAKNHDAKEIIEFILKGGLLASLTDFFFSLSSVFGGTGGILKSIKKDLDAVRGVLKAYQREINASTILEVAMAIGILAGSLWVLAQIPSDKIKSAGSALAIIAGAVAGFSALKDILKIFTNLSDKTNVGKTIAKTGPFDAIKNILTSVVSASIFANDATAKFVKICLGILLAAGAIFLVVKAMTKVADAFKALADIPPEVIEKGGKVMAQVMIAFGAFAMLAGTANRASSAFFAALGALILVFAIKKLVDVLAELGSDSKKMKNVRKAVDNFKGVFKAVAKIVQTVVLIGAAIALIQTVITGFSSLGRQSSLGTSQVLKQFGKNFTRIALSLVLITGAMAIMAGISKNISPGDWSRVVVFITLFAGIMGIIQTVAIGLASKGRNSGKYTADLMKQFGKNFIRIAASMLIIAAAFAIFKLIDLDLGTLIVVSLMFAALSGIITVLTKFAADLATKQKHLYFLENLKGIGKLFLKVAAALVIVAGAFAVFEVIAHYFGTKTLKIASVIFLAFSVIGLLLTWIANENATGPKGGAASAKSEAFVKNLNAISAVFLALAGALLIVSMAFAVMSSLNFDKTPMWQIGIVFAVFMAIVGFAVFAAGKWLKDNNLERTLYGLSAYALALAGSLAIIAGAFKIMDSLKMNSDAMWDVFWIFSILMGVMGAIAWLTAKFISNGKLFATLSGLSIYVLALAGSLVIIAAAFKIMDSLKMNVDTIGQVSFILGALLATMGVMAILAGVLLKDPASWVSIALVGGLIVVAAGSLCLAALAIGMIADAVPLEKMDGVLKILITMGAILAVMGIIGALAGATGLGAFGILAFALAIVAVGAACWLAAKGIEAIVTVLAAYGDKAAKNLVELSAAFKQAMKDFGDSFGNIMLVVLSLVLLGPAAIIAAVGLLALAIPVAIIAVVITNLIQVITDFTEAFGYFVDVVGEKGSAFASNISSVLNSLLDAIIETGPKLSSAIYTVITAFANGFFAAAVENAETITNAITIIIATVATAIVNNAYLISNAVTTLIMMTIMGILDALTENIDPMIKSFTAFIDELANAIENNLDSMMEAGEHLGEALMTGLWKVVTRPVSWGEKIADYLWPSFSTPGGHAFGNNSFGSATSSAFSATNGVSNNPSDAAAEQGSKDGESYSSAFMTVLSGIWGGDSSENGTMWDNLSSGATNFFNGLGDSLSSGWKSLTSGLNFNIGSMFGGGKEKSELDLAYEKGELDNLASSYDHVSRSAAEAAVSSSKAGDDIYYGIEKLEDGSEIFVKYTKEASGAYHRYWKYIYDPSDTESLFSNPLDYITKLTSGDFGDIQDLLTLSPVIDGTSLELMPSQIQEAIDKDYSVTVTPKLAGEASYDVNGPGNEPGKETNNYSSNDTYNNTFNITNSDPESVAKKVSSIIQRQAKRTVVATGK